MASEAAMLPPPLSTRSTSARMFSSSRASRIRARSDSSPIIPEGWSPGRMSPRATIRPTAGWLAGRRGRPALRLDGRKVLLGMHAHVLAVVVMAARLGQPGLDLFEAAQPVHQAGVQRHLSGVAAGGPESRQETVDVIVQQAGSSPRACATSSRQACHMPARWARDSPAPRRTCRRGGRIGKALGLARAEHVPVQRQLLHRALEVMAVEAEALQQHDAQRIEVQLVRVRREIVVAASAIGRVGDDRLAGVAEAPQRLRHGRQLVDAAACQPVDLQLDGLDARILGCRIDRLDQVADQRLARGRPWAASSARLTGSPEYCSTSCPSGLTISTKASGSLCGREASTSTMPNSTSSIRNRCTALRTPSRARQADLKKARRPRQIKG
jgi:hypothetical protein